MYYTIIRNTRVHLNIFIRNANAKDRIAASLLDGDGEMVESAKINGTMLDASLMVEIVARTLQAASARMILLKPKPMLLLDSNFVG